MTWTTNLKVSVSGVRGVVGESLTPALASDFAAAFGEYVGRGRVVVGRDTRNTGLMMEQAIVAGLLSVGCQPVLTGVTPTPTILINVNKLHANGGIAITASHNSVEWNAMKFIGPSGVFLNHTEAAELLDIYNQPDCMYVMEEDYRKIRIMNNVFDEHRRRIFNVIDPEVIRKSAFKVAVDCCNGVGALFSRHFLESLGCEVITINDEPDGRFRRPPEPIPENLSTLSSAVAKNECALGFAQDPDGDRLALVDETGLALGEQSTLVLAISHVLEKTPGNVIANIQTTKAAADVAAASKSKLFYSKVGEINVTTEMERTGAVIGGEGNSGGVICPAVHPCRDSYTAMALILEMMASKKEKLSQIMARLPKYFTKNLKVPCSSQNAMQIIRDLKNRFVTDNPVLVDGLRLEWPNSWVLIRPSNTEPVMRITAEAKNENEAATLAAKFAEEVKGN